MDGQETVAIIKYISVTLDQPSRVLFICILNERRVGGRIGWQKSSTFGTLIFRCNIILGLKNKTGTDCVFQTRFSVCAGFFGVFRSFVFQGFACTLHGCTLQVIRCLLHG